MNETLREKEELSRIDSENLRKTKEDIIVLRRKVDQHAELMAEKDRTVQVGIIYFPGNEFQRLPSQILHDEISTLQLELGQIEERNSILTKDNAKLLQRWLDAKQAEANKMNEANQFYETMRSQHQAVLSWRDGSDGGQGATGFSHNGIDSSSKASSISGKGVPNDPAPLPPMKDGISSPVQDTVDLTPNG
jgi:autophagy-related protein 16